MLFEFAVEAVKGETVGAKENVTGADDAATLLRNGHVHVSTTKYTLDLPETIDVSVQVVLVRLDEVHAFMVAFRYFCHIPRCKNAICTNTCSRTSCPIDWWITICIG